MTRAQRPRRRWWIVAAAVVAVAAALVGWLISSSGPEPTGPPAAAASPSIPDTVPSSGPDPRCQLRWETAPSGDLVPVNACAGPRDISGGRARGFAHDQTGAVYAAIHITMRMSATAGPAVYRPTYAEQTVGDSQDALSLLAREKSSTPSGDSRARRWWWKLGAGDPTGDLVVVELAAATAQAEASGSVAHLSVTLRWVDGDWKVQLPRPRATPMPSVDGYVALGDLPRGGA
ncbi:hypothetical protein [Amycolatopsis anabasis]|uniref:hypothetical protein n=1 Tax=Amycolatopsis anabasis TaxID=1840409 RepID=UPI00131D14D7|nr:hypothetical protein [Amycolatopsis anabasis]